MGSCLRTSQKCSRSSSPPPLWPQLSPLDPQLMVPQPHTSRRSSPLSHTPTNTELLMTTARPTSRSLRLKMETVSSPEASGSPSPTAESRPPPTPLTTPTDSSLMSPMREPQSTHQSPRRDTDMPQLTRPQSQLMLQSPLQLTLQLPKNLKIPKD